MQEDGFQVVTDIYGQYRLDREANEKCNYAVMRYSCSEFTSNQKAQKEQVKAGETQGDGKASADGGTAPGPRLRLIFNWKPYTHIFVLFIRNQYNETNELWLREVCEYEIAQ